MPPKDMPLKKAVSKDLAKEAVAKKEDESKKRKAEEKKEEPPKKELKKDPAPKAKAEPKSSLAAKPKAKAEAKEEVKKEPKVVPKEVAREPAAEVKEVKDALMASDDPSLDIGEKEKDAREDKRPTVKETISFNANDCTLNVVPACGGKVVMALTEGGMQYLIAGARANVGMKAGRYMYEVKIIEALNPAESSQAARGRVPVPRQLVRLGFSVPGSPLVLGDSEDGFFFDSEGYFVVGKKRVAASQRFTRDQVIGVLLNLDPKSPNANTLSLFREGERIAEPQPVPAHLVGKALFPHVAFRNVSVQMLFGPHPARALPFKCRMLQGAAQADVAVAPTPSLADGKFEVMLPVSFPDEGTFDWLDTFLEKHPHFVELSDRKIVEWAASSGLIKPKPTSAWKSSNDRPEFNYGLPGMDDGSIRRVINSVAPVVPRHYVIMEVKGNLVGQDRAEVLQRFNSPHFRPVAHVVMGEPTDEYKELQRQKLLKEKQDKADAEWRAKKAEEERKRQIEIRQKQLQEMRKQAEEQRKKAAEEARLKMEEARKKIEAAKKKAEEEKKAKDAAALREGELDAPEQPKEGEEPPQEEEAQEEVKAEEAEQMEVEEPKEEHAEEVAKQEEDEKKDVEMPQADEHVDDEEPPKVELTEEENKLWFRPPASGVSDITPVVLGQSFAHFTIPDEAEGFAEIRYEWQGAEESKEYLRKWVLEKKMTSRIEDLQPSQWFREKYAAWQKSFADWQAKQRLFKLEAAKKGEKKPEEPAKVEGEEAKDAEAKDAEMQEEVDVLALEDIGDTGSGEPLFAKFGMEDWALLQIRYELFLLQLAFRKDVNDPERMGVHDNHLSFYYNKYFRKAISPKHFGLNTNAELCDLLKDTVTMDSKTQVLSCVLPQADEDGDVDSVDLFVKLTELARRERQRRIDAGDETAKLKFSPMAVSSMQAAPRPAGMQQQQQQHGPRPALQQPLRPGAIANRPASPVAGGVRPGGGWQQPRPAQTWNQGGRPGFQPVAPGGRWPGSQSFQGRPPYGQKWR